MVVRIEKVNVYILPLHGGGELLALDRCNLVVDMESTFVKAFDRETTEEKMRFVASQINGIKKQYVMSTDGSMIKGKSVLTMKGPVFVASHVTEVVTLKMAVEDHKLLHSTLFKPTGH